MKNYSASIKAKLQFHARAHGVEFGALLEQYALGRLFWRLSQSRYADRFVLKGAQLFQIWSGAAHRPTRDADFLSYGEVDAESLVGIFTEICASGLCEQDGLVWRDWAAKAIREDNSYGGLRVRMIAVLGSAKIPVQVDVGFGDVVTPEPVEVQWRGLLDFPSAPLIAYPPQTVIAEKLEAAVSLGRSNSRMKDFYDIYWLSRNMGFERSLLIESIMLTFARRQTELPAEAPLALTDAFARDPSKQTQWKAFLRKSDLEFVEFTEAVTAIRRFLWPLLADSSVSNLEQRWCPEQRTWLVVRE